MLTPFPRGLLQPVVFSLSCSLRSLAKVLSQNYKKRQLLYDFNRNCLLIIVLKLYVLGTLFHCVL
ncbi:hypothetical protein BUZ15_10400 [Staphylococcus gallinarum]|nr:hypothetical protein BUZ00_12710 [Staphylococcus gallinarum]PTE74906.1 hypothetical protein BUY96_11870 [Staphylococcus gallinarum]PTL07442.1 hypothetical protein BUZ09_08425 [Staphylococcus gallinarum]PTL09341.1 hypothetical protein BUZ15_10400 [Staphylococcus gallinarum]RIL22673.1 hypothetical protein BUY97_10645 [Staphylococcus gallinarum]